MNPEATRLADLLDQWEDALDRGEDISVEEICSETPELLPELKRQIAALQAVDQRLTDTGVETDYDLSIDQEINLQSTFHRLKLHARGGLGVVYAGEDARLHRPVAIKFLRQRLLEDAKSQQVFGLEAEITSRLEHPGVVPIYGMGETEDGRSFYSMRFIQGMTLDEAITELRKHPEGFLEHSREFRGLLNHFSALCKTVAYAHSRGIIHRDIKPANVMLGRYGETLLVDWGLAVPVSIEDKFRVKDEQTLLPTGSSRRTHASSSEVGTPAYMSPEQAAGSMRPHPSCDIYALGVTLYKLIAGRVPIDAPTMSEMRQSIIRGKFDTPSKHNSRAPKPLEAICLKALASEPKDRYATAMLFAEDIERYLADDFVEAYSEPIGRRTARWARRHRRAVQVGLAAAVLFLIAALGFSARMSGIARQERIARSEASDALDLMAEKEVRTIALALKYQIEQRLSAVEELARHPKLVGAVERAYLANSEDRDSWLVVNQWLGQQHVRWKTRAGFESAAWFICLNDAKGTQIARAPFINPETGKTVTSWGNGYNYRQYYRGGKPNPPSDRESIPPITKTFIAAPHKSTNNNKPKATFSTPIWSADRKIQEPIGVLGMAIEVSKLTTLDRELFGNGHRLEDQILTIAYLRPDYYADESHVGGLIVQHPALKADKEGRAGLQFQVQLLPETLVETLKLKGTQVATLEEYADPMELIEESYGGGWKALISTVNIPAAGERDETCVDTGWAVILQRRPRR